MEHNHEDLLPERLYNVPNNVTGLKAYPRQISGRQAKDALYPHIPTYLSFNLRRDQESIVRTG